MKQIIGRFTQQTNKNFPVDCETFDGLQTNIAMVQALGNLVGDKAIISGCDPEQNNTRRKAGYVFVKTKDYPDGEVVYWEGGNVSGGMYLDQTVVPITSQGYNFPNAYTVRSLKPGVGTENYNWNDFKNYKTPDELQAEIDILQNEINNIKPTPLGIVHTWAGSSVPANYGLCEGQQLKIADYPQLYAAIGATFNNAIAADGSRYATTDGYFRLPDLRGRFVVGYNESDGDYNAYGKAGGAKQHALSVDEMPAHSHDFRNYYYIEGFADGGIDGNEYVGGNRPGSAETDYDNDYLFYKNSVTSNTGAGAAHENRPPYYVLAYIMQVK